MTTYEKPSLQVVELGTTVGYLALVESSTFDDPQIDDEPTDSYN